MPKKPPKNAFFFFMIHFKNEERRRGRHYGSLSEVSSAASRPWQGMTAQERGPFEKQAKDAKVGPSKEVEKYTSQGIPLSFIDREQKESEQEELTMMRSVKNIVIDSFNDNSIASRPFFFISGNYFIKSDENYLPAEIAIVKFSFETGIINKFHTYVDPEKIPLGYQFEAKDNSEKTHRLPIPPNCKGEKNYQLILKEMKAFMGGEPLPILFTSKDNIPMIKSFIQSFIDFGNNDDSDRYRVYPIHHVFFEIKETAVQNSARTDAISFKSIHVAEQHLRREDYAYLAGTSCMYHEELDCAKYCALAHVQSWAYIFLDHICVDLNIELIPGKQFPAEIDVSHLANGAQNNSWVSNMNDTKLNDTNDTRNRTGIDERQSSSRSVTASNTATHSWSNRPVNTESVNESEDFPTLGSRNRKRNARSSQHVIDNPWDTSSSSSDGNPRRQQRDFRSDSDDTLSFVGSDMNSSHSRGMGRGSVLFRNESGYGRGRSHR